MIPESRLPELAFDTVEEVLEQNVGKHGTDAYVSYSQECHINKGIRHALTHLLIKTGWQRGDADNHLKLAITRFTMALAVEQP